MHEFVKKSPLQVWYKLGVWLAPRCTYSSHWVNKLLFKFDLWTSFCAHPLNTISLHLLNTVALKETPKWLGCTPRRCWPLAAMMPGQRRASSACFRRERATAGRILAGQRGQQRLRGRCCRSCSPSGLGSGETRRAGERGSSGSAKSESGQGEIPRGTEADSKTPQFARSDAKQRRKTHPWPPERSGAQLGRCSASWCFKIQKPFKRASCRRASLGKQPLSLLLTLQDSRTALPATSLYP